MVHLAYPAMGKVETMRLVQGTIVGKGNKGRSQLLYFFDSMELLFFTCLHMTHDTLKGHASAHACPSLV